MITAITSAILAIVNAASSAWKRRQQTLQVEHQTTLAIEKAKQQLLTEEIKFQHKLSIAQLTATPRWFKVVTFFGWFAPYAIILVSPDTGRQIFDNLSNAPLWYVQTAQVLLFAVWGISVSKDTIANIFSNIAENWRLKSQYKVVKEDLIESKKMLYEAIRNAVGPLSQQQVNTIEEVLDK